METSDINSQWEEDTMSHTPVPEKMSTYELDHLWKLYREFTVACNMANMAESAPEFLSWIERFRLSTTEQPSEVVRPDLAAVDFLHGKYCVVAYYPTREAAETARKMLLGE